jgi:serine/threonine protein phosphatase 1
MRKFAISDIHGCLLSFEALLDKIAFSSTDELYLLGDYIDRGPNSKGVLDLIFNLKSEGYQVRCLMGNHDYFLAKPEQFDLKTWKNDWGGFETLSSFNTRSISGIGQEYFDFIGQLPFVMEVEQYILVHAGLPFWQENPLSQSDYMLVARYWHAEIDKNWLAGRIIVHGHTPVAQQEIINMLARLPESGYIDIDNGCFTKNQPGKGNLCAFDLTNYQLSFQPCLDDMMSYWKRR